MTCSYSAGYLKALAEHHDLKTPDIVIADSGSAGASVYYVAGQYKEITKIWSKYIPTKKMLNIWRFGRVLNIDYLVDTVIKKLMPLDITAFEASPIEYFIPALDYHSGKVRYFTRDDKQEIYEILRATKAMPILYRKRVMLDGKLYCDSRLSSSAEANIAKAIKENATHIIEISNNNPSIVTKIIYKVWLLLRGSKFNRRYSSQEKYDLSCSRERAQILSIRPENLKIKGLKNNKKLIQNAILRGESDCIENKELEKFLKDFYEK